MNIFECLIRNINERALLEKAIDDLVYNWLTAHYKLWTSLKPTEDQIGTLYIGPNNAYSKYSINYDHDFCETKWGWDWCFTNDYKAIKIQYNIVKNQWLDINEDNEDIVSFDELLKYR